MSDRGRDRSDPASRRVYVGNLPNDVEREQVEKLFGKFGDISDISIKKTRSGSSFAFIEYGHVRDAEDAIRDRDGFDMDGCRLRVEIPFNARTGGSRRAPAHLGRPRRGNYRVMVECLPPTGSWQDLKDHMREAGECAYGE
eukprot:GHVU01065777.1.p1 GENE.GHVU01065777.1~~GHVU01065777.1.p1  ORF type:complete len:141 (-),score=17.48 GHVU01065777.1:89-511(-)